jgi:hypothetical protein
MDVDKTGGVFLNDFVFGVTTLQLGGTLQLNITGEALAEGDVISLFNFTSASGTFSTITPSTPGPVASERRAPTIRPGQGRAGPILGSTSPGPEVPAQSRRNL